MIPTKEAIEQRVFFIRKELESLDNYLPETYQYLMKELDEHERRLMEIRMHEFYSLCPVNPKEQG